jgi:GNAT superfamily N-acetyltransferase
VEFTIEPITGVQIPTLLELIRELAAFERLENEVQATVESLHNSLLGPNAVAGALFAQHGRDAAGYALYFFTFSSFSGRCGLWLDDVYVRPDFRRRGLGTALIRAVAQIGVERNCGRFEWTALNWNTRALELYRGMGAQTLEDWVLLRMNAEGLRRFAKPSLGEINQNS